MPKLKERSNLTPLEAELLDGTGPPVFDNAELELWGRSVIERLDLDNRLPFLRNSNGGQPPYSDFFGGPDIRDILPPTPVAADDPGIDPLAGDAPYVVPVDPDNP